MVVNNTELSVDGLTTSGNQWGVNIDQGSRVTLANAEIAEDDSVVFEGQDDSGSLTVESGSLQNIKTQGASTGGTITISGGTIASVSNEAGAEVAITGGTVTGQVANSGSGSISVTGGSFATADVEDVRGPGPDGDPDPGSRRRLLPGEDSGRGQRRRCGDPARAGAGGPPLYRLVHRRRAAALRSPADTTFDAAATLYARWEQESSSGGSSGGGDHGRRLPHHRGPGLRRHPAGESRPGRQRATR